MFSNHPFLSLLFRLLIFVVILFVVLILLGADGDAAMLVCLCIEGLVGVAALVALIVGFVKKDEPVQEPSSVSLVSNKKQTINLGQKQLPQLVECKEMLRKAFYSLQEVRDEEGEAYDNLPQSIQIGERGDMMQEAIDNLEDATSSIEDAISTLEEAISQTYGIAH